MTFSSSLSSTDDTRLATREPKWVKHSMWWHIYPLGFTGAPHSVDAPSICHRLNVLTDWLDYAVNLGVSGLLVGPIFSSSTHGYDTVDYFTIDSRLGNHQDFLSFVEAAHSRGLRIMLDGVFNHVGRNFPRFKGVIEGREADSAWFIRTPDAGLTDDNFKYETFEGHHQLVTLNHAHPDVVSFVVDVMCYWLEAGIDGWRLDAAYAVPAEFWAAVIPQVRRRYPSVYFAAEVIHGDYVLIAESAGFDSVTQYELWKAIWSSINDRNWFELAWALDRHNSYLEAFNPLTFLGNHDVTRIASQIEDYRHLEHALVLLFTIGGTPCVYYGDEQAYQGIKEHRAGGDDDIRPAFPLEGPKALAPFGWPIYRLHQQLIGFRRRNSWLHSSKTQILNLKNQQLVFRSHANEQSITVALNLGDESMPLAGLSPGPPTLGDCESNSAAGWLVPPHRWAIFS